jgi:hypothetical protein
MEKQLAWQSMAGLGTRRQRSGNMSSHGYFVPGELWSSQKGRPWVWKLKEEAPPKCVPTT